MPTLSLYLGRGDGNERQNDKRDECGTTADPRGVEPAARHRIPGGCEWRIEDLPDRLLIYAPDGEAVAEQVHARGLRPESVLVRRSTLEDVFLRLTGRSLVD